jgi:hypothetical protein
MIVLNSLSDTGAGFGHDTNKITVFDKDGGEVEYPLKSKKELAADLVAMIIKKLINETSDVFSIHAVIGNNCVRPGTAG